MSVPDQSQLETLRISSIVRDNGDEDHDSSAPPPHLPADPPSSAPVSVSTQDTVTISNVNAQPRSAPVHAPTTRRKTKQYAVSTRWEREVAEGTVQPDFSSYFCCCATRIGNMHALLSYPDGAPLVIAGPCWPFCAFITLPLLLVVPIIVMVFLIVDVKDKFQLPLWLLAIYVPCFVATLVALFCVSCRDPGLMERVTDEEAGEGGWFWNEQVGSFRPPGALYCRECGVLIQDYDHLCPWTGTGIGRGNMLAFKVFVVCVNVLCYVTLGIVIWALLDGLAGNR